MQLPTSLRGRRSGREITAPPAQTFSLSPSSLRVARFPRTFVPVSVFAFQGPSSLSVSVFPRITQRSRQTPESVVIRISERLARAPLAIERIIFWTVTCNGHRIRLRYLGAAKNNAWLHNRCAAINLRTMLRHGLTRRDRAWALA
jgi:hypothetical protein